MNSRGNAIALIKSRRAAMKAVGRKLPRRRKPPRQLHPTGIEREYYAAIIKLIEPLFQEIRENLIPRLPEIIQQHQEETRVDGSTKQERMDAAAQQRSDDTQQQRSDVTGQRQSDATGQQRKDATEKQQSDATEQQWTDDADQQRAERADRFYGEIITRIFGNIKVGVALQMPDLSVQDQSDKFARRASAFNKAQVDKQFQSVLGIPVLRTERWLEPQVASFVERNVSLIKSIPEDYLKKVEQMVRHSVESGVATASMEQDIIDEFDVARHRAHLIARDQISKYNGKLTELRQKEAGVSRYDWSTSRDERVRPRHAAVDGQRFSWDDPPPVGNKGEKLHPGQDYQ